MNLEQIKQRAEAMNKAYDSSLRPVDFIISNRGDIPWAADTILQLVAEVERFNSLNQMLKEKLTIIRGFGDRATFDIADAAIKAAEKVTK